MVLGLQRTGGLICDLLGGRRYPKHRHPCHPNSQCPRRQPQRQSLRLLDVLTAATGRISSRPEREPSSALIPSRAKKIDGSIAPPASPGGSRSSAFSKKFDLSTASATLTLLSVLVTVMEKISLEPSRACRWLW